MTSGTTSSSTVQNSARRGRRANLEITPGEVFRVPVTGVAVVLHDEAERHGFELCKKRTRERLATDSRRGFTRFTRIGLFKETCRDFQGRFRALHVLAIGAATLVGVAQQQERSQIPDKYKWDLTKIYPSDEAWRAAKDALVAELPRIAAYKGTLGSSPQKLADALELASRLSKDFSRVYVYASMMSDQDTRVSSYQGMQQEMTQVGATFGAETAFVEPEILKIDRATVDRFVASEPRLKIYRLYLDDILRRAPHTGSEAEERLLAKPR